MKIPRYHARVEWNAHREIATGSRLIRPVWFAEDGPRGDGWSLVLTLSEPVARSDKTTMAIAHLAFPWAPHEHLRPGRVLELFEGKTLLARVQLGELAGFIEADT